MFVFYDEVPVKCPRVREREVAQHLEERERERKWGRKEEMCGPSNGNKLRPTRIES